MQRLPGFAFLLACLPVRAQLPTAPVIYPRGVVNLYTLQAAPAPLAPGSLFRIDGLNLGPSAAVAGTGSPLPVELGSPAVRVLVGGVAAPLLSVASTRIVAQVPVDTPAGVVAVVVRRGDASSAPSRILVNPLAPSLRYAGDTGYGAAAASTQGVTAALSATGLGATVPAVASGVAGAADGSTRPAAKTVAFVGGLSAPVTASLSPSRVGEFNVSLTVPDASQSGDIVTLRAGNTTANRAALGSGGTPDVRFSALPQGAPDIRSLTTSDLRGPFVLANGARDGNGCWPSYLFDFARQKASAISGCPAAANQNAASPFTAVEEGNAVAALEGANALRIFSPERDELRVPLPDNATAVLSFGAGALTVATASGTYVVDPDTGAVSAAPASAGSAGLFASPSVDLGNGMNQVLAVAATASGAATLVVADDANQPTRAKLAVVGANSTTAIDFPAGWLPLLAPSQQLPAGAPGGAGAVLGMRAAAVADSATRSVWVPVRNPDGNHGMAGFNPADGSATLVPFPTSSFVANCAARISLFTPQAAPSIVIPVSNAVQNEIKTPCPAKGFVAVDPSARTATLVSIPGQAQANIGSMGMLNDYIYAGTNSPADSLVVLDTSVNTIARVNPPSGVSAFGTVTPVSEMSALVAAGQNSSAGDAGLVLFDLAQQQSQYYAVPEGFASVRLAGVLPVTRKAVARAVRTGSSGSQYVIYDLTTADSTVLANPDGVTWVGSAPQQTAGSGAPPQGGPGGPGEPGGGSPPTPGGGFPGPPGGGFPGGGSPGGTTTAIPVLTAGLEAVNAKANTVAAVGFDSAGKQAGLVFIRVP